MSDQIHPSGASSSPPVEDAETEVVRLREELEKAHTKLISWKDKTKAGVDQLRQQVVDLATALETANAERKAMADQLAQSKAAHQEKIHPASSSPSGAGAEGTVSLAVVTDALEDIQDWFLMYEAAKVDVFATNAAAACRDVIHAASEKQCMGSRSASPSPAAEPPSQVAHTGSEDLEAYKRRVAMTLKLQTKNCETLQRQVEELKASLASTRESLKERERALSSRDETVSLLEQRLDAADRQNQQLAAQHESVLRGPDMEAVNAMEERVEQEVAQVRAEYAAREDALFVQHRDELDRMRALAERELEQTRQDYEERLALAVEEAAQCHHTGAAVDTGSQSSRREDAGYAKLLSEYEALEARLRALEAENGTLRREAAYNRAHAVGAAQSTDVVNGKGASRAFAHTHLSVPEPTSLSEARGTIAEQQAMLVSLSEQLWKVKKELLDTQRAKKEPSLPAGALDPQQAAYLRSILVRALCSRNDDKVLVNLLPVFSTMLHLEADDLRAIYSANPAWISSKK